MYSGKSHITLKMNNESKVNSSGPGSVPNSRSDGHEWYAAGMLSLRSRHIMVLKVLFVENLVNKRIFMDYLRILSLT